VNIHPSLLPRWRGAAPIQRTVYAGDTETGVTIMQMDVGLDTGPILLQQKMQMAADETSQTLHDKLAQVGASALIETLDLLAQEKIHAIPQENHYTTYANKISKEEALLDWEKPALELEREVRAFNPWPVSYTTWKEKTLRVWQAKAITNVKVTSPRTIMYAARDGIDIATSDGVLRLLQVQLPGGKVLSVADFYNAHRNELIVGEKLI
jgi:methionyl-tRNA formyltransferase